MPTLRVPQVAVGDIFTRNSGIRFTPGYILVRDYIPVFNRNIKVIQSLYNFFEKTNKYSSMSISEGGQSGLQQKDL